MENYVVIDLDKWQTQKDYAEENNVSPPLVNAWIKRKRIEFLHVKELDLTLVRKGAKTKRVYTSKTKAKEN